MAGEEFCGKNLSYREEMKKKLKCEEIVNEFPPNIIQSAHFWIDSILSASTSSAVRPVCQTGAAYSLIFLNWTYNCNRKQ